ncbi:hypothetical protein EB169_06075 [archaeon]|nr:hypothetical protein [archaeon]
MALTFKTKQPITLKAGTGVKLSVDDKEFTKKDFDGTDKSDIRISIGQDVSTNASVQFNNVILGSNSLTVGTGSGALVFSDGKIVGDLQFQNNLQTTDNVQSIGNLTYTGTQTSTIFTSSITSVTQSNNTGSNIFGSDLDSHKHFFTGSLDVSGSYNLNQYRPLVKNISNDSSLSDKSQNDVVTEYAAYTYFSSQSPIKSYLRKSFVHTGSFINTTTSRFSVVTASAPSNMTSTSENDFMFFINGMLVENDALTIQQNSSNLDLTLDTDSLGYELSPQDEVIGFGKFNS